MSAKGELVALGLITTSCLHWKDIPKRTEAWASGSLYGKRNVKGKPCLLGGCWKESNIE